MHQSSTVFNFCNASIRLQDENGLDVDVSGSSNEVTIDFDNDLGDYKAFGERWKGRLECGSDASIKLKILTSTAANEAYYIWKRWYFGTRGGRRLKIYVPDANTGSDIYQATVKLASANGLGGPADEAKPGMITLDLKPHLGVTHNTVGS